jgi:hypothetical protein
VSGHCNGNITLWIFQVNSDRNKITDVTPLTEVGNLIPFFNIGDASSWRFVTVAVMLNIISLFLEMNAQHSALTGRDYCCLSNNGIEKCKKKI